MSLSLRLSFFLLIFRRQCCAVWLARARYINNTPATAKSVPPGLNNAAKNNVNPPLKRVSEARSSGLAADPERMLMMSEILRRTFRVLCAVLVFLER